jgi:hypothetical protein
MENSSKSIAVEVFQGSKVTDVDNLPVTGNKNITDSQVLELIAGGIKPGRIAKLLGCSRNNIYERLKRLNIDVHSLDNFNQNKAGIFSIHQQRALRAMTDDKLKKASARDLAIVTGTLYDKERIERGGSDNKNQVSIILNMACNQHDGKTIDIQAEIVDK